MNKISDLDYRVLFNKWFYDLLINIGVPHSWASYTNMFVLLFLMVGLVYGLQYLTKSIILLFIRRLNKFINFSFLNYLVANKFHKYLALLVPYTIIVNTIPMIFAMFRPCIVPLTKLVKIYFVFLLISILMAVIKSGADLLSERPAFKNKPMVSYLQVVRILFYLIGLVMIYSIITGNSPTAFFAAMGAASALLLLIFQDSIKGFAASIQVTSNDMVRIGDWITLNKFGVDGVVTEINLTTVKVKNFDLTMTTMPTYSLISESIKNWRHMQESGARRLKRTILISQRSIRYLVFSDLEKMKKIDFLSDFIDKKNLETRTNLSLFMQYCHTYLSDNERVKKDMTFLVHLLEAGIYGLPLEIYVFINTTVLSEYESACGEIMEHLIAVVPYFGLDIYECENGGIKDERILVGKDLVILSDYKES